MCSFSFFSGKNFITAKRFFVGFLPLKQPGMTIVQTGDLSTSWGILQKKQQIIPTNGDHPQKRAQDYPAKLRKRQSLFQGRS
jgi:hypothetical protein